MFHTTRKLAPRLDDLKANLASDSYAALMNRANDLSDECRALMASPTPADLPNDLADEFAALAPIRAALADLEANRADALADEFANRAPQSPGMYANASGTFRVVKSKSSGNLYAKKLNTQSGGFSYEPGAIYNLRESDRMTLAEAKALGHETGFCCVCGAELTDPKSVAAGIGPICATRV